MELITDRSNRSSLAELMIPHDLQDLSLILSNANKTKTPITTLGGRTALTGSSIPPNGTLALEMKNWFKISQNLPYQGKYIKAKKGKTELTWLLDPGTHKAIFAAGVLIEDLDQIISAHNLLYLPTPGYKKCTLGGTIATNASGPRTFGFGATRDHVWFLRVMLPDGEILDIERGQYISHGEDLHITTKTGKNYSIPIPNYEWKNIKNATGLFNQLPLDLIDLFIGSEGTLGVFLDIGIQLSRFESPIVSEILFWENQRDALKIGIDLTTQKWNGSDGFISIEYIDEHALQFAQDPEYKNMKGALEIEYFANDLKTQKEVQRVKDTTSQILTGDQVAPFRYSIPLAVSNYLVEKNITKIGTDFAVPLQNFPAMIYDYMEAQREFAKFFDNKTVSTALWGHFGNGHLHLNFFPQDEQQTDFAQKKYKQLAQKAVSLGGVVSAEHGLGKKTFHDGEPLLQVQNPEMIPQIKKTKLALDPYLILNQGNMIGDQNAHN